MKKQSVSKALNPDERLPPQKRLELNARSMAKRIETRVYKFSPMRTVTSRELDAVLKRKIEVFEDETQRDMSDDRAQWSDRLGLLAKPLSADVYLMCERGPDTMHAPARFFLDQLLEPEIPDAKSRFPFDDVAIQSSKKISKMVSTYYGKKVHAASVIQRNYRFYRFRKNAKLEARKRHFMAARLQFWFKKIRWRAHQAKVEKGKRLHKLVNIQRVWRGALGRMRVIRLTKTYKMRKMVLLQTWTLKCIKNWRKHRGRARRENGQVKKIQALVRGRAARKLKWSAVFIRVRIAIWWKRVWRRKYGDRARQFIRKLRNSLWTRDVRRVQNTVRQFLARIHVARRRITIRAHERSRQHGEVVALERALKRSVDDAEYAAAIGWDWDVFRGWDGPADAKSTSGSSKGSQGSKKSGGSSRKSSGKGGGPPSAGGSVDSGGSGGDDGSSKSSGGARQARLAGKLTGQWRVPRDYVEEFLSVDELAHRVLEGHEVEFMPPHARAGHRPFFPGAQVSLQQRITAAILLSFVNMPQGSLHQAAVDLLVNRTDHLNAYTPTVMERIAHDKDHLGRREGHLRAAAIHKETQRSLARQAKLAMQGKKPVETVHHHHQHVVSLGGSLSGGDRIVAKKTRTKKRMAESCAAQMDLIAAFAAKTDARVRHQQERLQHDRELSSRITTGQVNMPVPSLRGLVATLRHNAYQRRRDRVLKNPPTLPGALSARTLDAHAMSTLHHVTLAPLPPPSFDKWRRAQEQARAPTLGKDLYASAWAAAARMPWHDGASLLAVAAPSRSVMRRVWLSSGPSVHLPDVVVHQAVLARRWVRHTLDVLQAALIHYREHGDNANQPRRVCASCGEGFALDEELTLHSTRGCLGRWAVLMWVSRAAFVPGMVQFAARCNRLPPTMLREAVNRSYKTLDKAKYLAAASAAATTAVPSLKVPTLKSQGNSSIASDETPRKSSLEGEDVSPLRGIGSGGYGNGGAEDEESEEEGDQKDAKEKEQEEIA